MPDTKNIHERLGKHILADGFPMVMDLEKSHDSYIVNSKGEEYLDMFSMFASASIGYNHPHLVANQAFLGKMAINKPSMSDVYNEHYADFLDTFSRVAIPKELSYAFFVSGGALAVENALKAAFDWRTRLNMSRGVEVEADLVIHFKEAFHGRSGYTMSLTNTKDPRKHMYFPKFTEWPRVVNPKLSYPLTDNSLDQTRELEQLALEQIEIALVENPNRVACIVIETIQGEGGDNYFRKEFLHALRKVCDENEILLVLDEVQTGVAMTGKMWAYQHYDLVPDIISFGKKAQVCGILANREKMDQVPHNVFQESSRINSTFGGNFIDMMRFKLILEVIEKDNLQENAAKMGKLLLEELQRAGEDYPAISNIRGLGLWVAFDLKDDETRNHFLKKTYEHKLLLLPCGMKSIRFRPHLTVTEAEVKKAIKIVRDVLAHGFHE